MREQWQLVPASDHPEDDSGAWQIFRRVDGKDQFFGGFDTKENLVEDVVYLNALEARAEQAEAKQQNANAQRDYWQRAAQTSAEASRVRFQEKRQAEARNRELTAALEQIERLHPADEGKSYDIARAALAANVEAAAAPLPPGHDGVKEERGLK